MGTKQQQQDMEKVKSLIGNREPKKSDGGGSTGYNQKIADLILSDDGTIVAECGRLLFDDYNPAFDTSTAKGKAVRTSMRETRIQLAKSGNNVYKVKISKFDEITIACSQEQAVEKEKAWKREANSVKQLFQNS